MQNTNAAPSTKALLAEALATMRGHHGRRLARDRTARRAARGASTGALWRRATDPKTRRKLGQSARRHVTAPAYADRPTRTRARAAASDRLWRAAE